MLNVSIYPARYQVLELLFITLVYLLPRFPLTNGPILSISNR